MMKRFILSLLVPLMFGLWTDAVQAARTFTTLQTSPAPGSTLDMGTVQPFTFRVTNTSGGGNAGERIYEMRFRLNNGTLFDAATTAPAGWTRTGYTTTTVTFRATSWANSIPTGGFVDFILVMSLTPAGADANQTLRDARASFTLDTDFSNGISRTGRTTINNQGSWSLRSLQITSFLATDLLGNTSVVAGNQFRVVMTVRNVSSTTQTSIISVANPPAMVTSAWTGPVPTNVPPAIYNPNPLTLAPGASGTITFLYNTNSGSDGNVTFGGVSGAYVRNNTGNATSRAQNSNTLSVGRFSASITVTPTSPSPNCEYEGNTVTVRMRLTNDFPYNIINVTPTLTPSVGAPVVYQSGPSPAAPNGPVVASGTFDFTWVYLVSGGSPGALFSFSGSATGTGQTGGNPTRTTPVATSASVKRGGYSPTVSPTNAGTSNADSTNEILRWLITNNGCTDVTQVSVTIPAGWTLATSDPYFSYSLVDQDSPPNPGTAQIEDIWTVAGTNPVIFTAPLVPYNVLPLIPASPKQGDFRLVFSATPAAAEASVFQLRIIDTNNAFVDRTTTVTVDPFGTGGRNDTNKVNWREVFQ
jgi:hypothetical protein